jgi:hypothetical protein
LDIFRSRIPPKDQIVLPLATCVFFVFSWSIVWYFHKAPGWLLFLPPKEVLGIFAYTQGFALLESLAIWLCLILLAMLLPAQAFRARFASQGTMTVFVAALWAILLRLIAATPLGLDAGRIALWAAFFLTSMVLSWILVARLRPMENALGAIADRLTVFLYIYVPLGLLGLVVVIVRNVG